MAENFQGQDAVMNLSFVPLINESDVEYGTIVILDDVTHQAKLEEQLTQSEKLSALGFACGWCCARSEYAIDRHFKLHTNA